MRTCALLVLVCLLTLALPLPRVHAAAPAPSARVVPARATIRGKVTVIGTHLRPRSTIALLLAVPNLKVRRVERLLGATHADAKGNVRVTATIPLVTTCGSASIYLISNQAPTETRASFYLTGCSASGKKGAPPAPPTSPHKP